MLPNWKEAIMQSIQETRRELVDFNQGRKDLNLRPLRPEHSELGPEIAVSAYLSVSWTIVPFHRFHTIPRSNAVFSAKNSATRFLRSP